MIKTLAQYETAKNYIDSDMQFYDYTLSDKMTSLEMNLYLEDTEYYFDILYEKLRTLEEIVDYLDSYSNTKITKIKNSFAEKEIKLNYLVDEYKQESTVTYAVTWDRSNLITIKDRDGAELSAAAVTEKYAVTSGSNLSEHQEIVKITKSESSHECFSDNLASCLEENFYITDYSLDEPAEIYELLEIEITDPNDFNYVKYSAVNCDVEYMGKNDSNNILIKLKAGNMNKKLENFSYKIFKDASLNNIETLSIESTIKNVSNKQRKLADGINKMNSRKYLDEIKQYHSTKENNEIKSEIINDSKE